jgi:putative multiple sugar transport system ATP-binding protein
MTASKLLDLMLELKAQGVACIIISHKLNEVRYVADTVTVIRDGMTVSTLNAKAGLSEDEIVRDMVGRDMTHRFPAHSRTPADMLLEVANWNVWHPEHADRQVIRDAAFNVRAGEVVGIAGLMGSGRTEFAMSIFGRSYGRKISGSVKLKGKPVDVSSVDRAIASGISYVTEDRKSLGLVLDETIRNTTLANLDGVSSGVILSRNEETKVAETYREALAIRTPSVFQKNGQPFGRQPTKSGAGKMVVHQSPRCSSLMNRHAALMSARNTRSTPSSMNSRQRVKASS